MTRFMGLDIIVYTNWTQGSLWPIMGLTTQTNHQLAINALDAKGFDMVSVRHECARVPHGEPACACMSSHDCVSHTLLGAQHFQQLIKACA